jgi:predicted CxxxxCH...CXXCH cytochrome family protein
MNRVAVPGADSAVAAAPPRTATGAPAGAHLAHVNKAGGFGSASSMRCANCHLTADPVHPSGGAPSVRFGAVAVTGGAVPTYAAGTCAATYCHGNWAGTTYARYGLGAAPRWTDVGTAGCGTCHGAPPAAPHPQRSDCGGCHPGYTATTVSATLHVNGVADVEGLSCTSCHGDVERTPVPGADPNVKAAPPLDVNGSATGPAVGAHLAHVNKAGGLSHPFTCATCHNPVPTSTSHATGSVVVAFSGLALSPAGPAPTSDGTTCSNTYCHGNFAGLPYDYVNPAQDGKNATVSWTSGPMTCQSCHSTPPVSHYLPFYPGAPTVLNHSGGGGCNTCHPDVDSTGTTITVPQMHVNGYIDETNCGACH